MSSPARRIQTSPYGWWQPARFLRPAGPPSPLSQASGSGAEAGAILSPPAPALRNDLPESVPRNGGPGESRHGGPGGWPPVRLRRPPAILSCLSDRSERHIPKSQQKREPSNRMALFFTNLLELVVHSQDQHNGLLHGGVALGSQTAAALAAHQAVVGEQCHALGRPGGHLALVGELAAQLVVLVG